MKKKISFLKPFPTQSHSLSIIYIYPFTSVNIDLIGSPEERARTQEHQINVKASFTLLMAWGYDIMQLHLHQSKIEKILFEYAKRHLKKHMITATELPEIINCELTTQNTEIPCIFDHNRIQSPQECTFELNTDDTSTKIAPSHKVLFLSSDPKNTSRLRLDTEQREICEKIALSKYRDNIEFKPQVSLRAQDFSQAILDFEPTVVHFSGHGSKSGSICLEDNIGNAKPIDAKALGLLFSNFTGHIKCVILNACHSAVQSSEISNHIDYVVGMSDSIGDDAATAFSVGFYQGIGAGKSIPESFQLGVTQIAMIDIQEHLKPQLFCRHHA